MWKVFYFKKNELRILLNSNIILSTYKQHTSTLKRWTSPTILPRVLIRIT